jgi:prevent-host-death family protein
MCYMERVGIRELRQNLSVYLRRVEEGERFEVTDRGRPVAVLGPRPRSSSVLDELVTMGLARPARGHLLDLGPPLPPRGTMSLSDALQEQREERI